MGVAVLLLALYVYAYAAIQTAQNTYRLHEAGRTLQGELYDLRRQRAELEGLRDYLRSDEYIEAVARERFALVRPGEIAVAVDAPESSAPEREPGQRWWEALFGR